MTAYAFADVAGTTLAAFDPVNDTLVFGAGGGATRLALGASGADVVVSWLGQSVTLAGVSLAQLDGPQFVFGDGTLWRQGTSGGDSFVGTSGADAFDLRAGGVDTLSAGDGNDVIDLGDTLDSADVINGDGGQVDVVRLAGNYAETVVLSDTTIRGVEQFILGTGGTIRLQLSGGLLSSATPASFESVLFDGTAQTAVDAVYLDGRLALKEFGALMGAGDDTVLGGARNDTLDGAGGANFVAGSAGDDRIVAGSLGSSTLLGGAGNDSLSVTYGSPGTSGVVMAGGTGSDTLTGGEGNDELRAAGWQDAVDETVIDEDSNTNRLFGGGGHDALWGDAGRDTLIGGFGDDMLLGGGGADSLEGGDGDDSLSGGDGADRLDGGTGWDVLDGGAGDDWYDINDSAQSIVEAADGGYDTVMVYTNDYTLSDHVEYARLAGDGSDVGGRLVGNAQDNLLVAWDGGDTLEGGAGNDTMNGGGGGNRLVGGDGDDEYDLSAGDVVVEVAGGGVDTVIVYVNGRYVLPAEVENAILSGGDDVVVGNAKDNVLTSTGSGLLLRGLGGNDTLTADAFDTLVGGIGDDTYILSGSGSVVELAGEGTDTLVSSRSNGYPVYLGDNMENLTLTGSALEGYGNALDNVIRGSDAANELGGRAGADTLIGGGGNDQYYVQDAGEVLIEMAGGGTDRVLATLDFKLGANIEGLYLYNYIYDVVLDLRGTGNALDNTLRSATGGNDTLDGGAGADTMEGGWGNDIYLVDNVGDVVVDDSGYRDTVRSSVNYTLTNAGDVEVLVLLGAATQGTGNIDNNELRGNSANNRLDGGAGADRMFGGGGDDTYIADHGSDRALESGADGGVDTVLSSASFKLSDHVEKLILTGTGAVNATGSAQDNLLVGNVAANQLDGGEGADTLRGGLGNDVYVVDSSDVVVETADGGIDTVESSASYTLGARLENLVLSGRDDIDGKGNALANMLRGNAGHNRLDGGAGTDTMEGGDGADVYVVNDAGDVVLEKVPDQWRDTVVASVDYTLGKLLDDLVLAANATRGSGNAGENALVGNARSNLLDGGGGNDTLWGGGGDDTLIGGVRADDLYGDAGNDSFFFLSSADSNRFAYDLIFDFTRGEDRIDLSQMDGNTGADGQQSMRFAGQVGTAPGDVWYEVIEGGIVLFASTDADKGAEFVLVLAGVNALDSADFIL